MTWGLATASSELLRACLRFRQDICHMHHMQRMCKIISPRVKFYVWKVFFEQIMKVSFCFFLVIFSHVYQL